jgi:hypothetical protein
MPKDTVEAVKIERKEVYVCDADGCVMRHEDYRVPEGWTQVTVEDGESIQSDRWAGKCQVKQYCPNHKIVVRVEDKK